MVIGCGLSPWQWQEVNPCSQVNTSSVLMQMRGERTLKEQHINVSFSLISCIWKCLQACLCIWPGDYSWLHTQRSGCVLKINTESANDLYAYLTIVCLSTIISVRGLRVEVRVRVRLSNCWLLEPYQLKSYALIQIYNWFWVCFCNRTVWSIITWYPSVSTARHYCTFCTHFQRTGHCGHSSEDVTHTSLALKDWIR